MSIALAGILAWVLVFFATILMVGRLASPSLDEDNRRRIVMRSTTTTGVATATWVAVTAYAFWWTVVNSTIWQIYMHRRR
jgi:hypothetical protein